MYKLCGIDLNRANDVIFSNINDIINYCNQKSVQGSVQVSVQVSAQVRNIISHEFGNKIIDILAFLKDSYKSKKEILYHLGLTNHSSNKKRHIDSLIENKLIAYTIPEM